MQKANRGMWRIALRVMLMMCAVVSAEAVADEPKWKWKSSVAWQDDGMDPALAEATVDYFEAYEAPQFREGHRLPRLSLFEALPVEAMKHLAEHWGYGLHLNVDVTTVEKLGEEGSAVRRLLDLTASDPERYPLQLKVQPMRHTLRLLSNMPKDDEHRYMRAFFTQRRGDGEVAWEGDFVSLFPREAFVLDDQGEFVQHPHPPSHQNYPPSPAVSPMPAGDAVIEAVAELNREMVDAIAEYAPVTMIINGGEYGVHRGGHYPIVKQVTDPRVRQAWNDDGRPWVEYISDRKQHQERLAKEVLTEGLNDPVYIYYAAVSGGHPRRHEQRNWIHSDFVYRPGISTWPSPRHYSGYKTTGFIFEADLLTQALNCRAQEIDAGSVHTYPWVSQGWPGRPLADSELYQGFVTCLYTSGAISGIAYGARPHVPETLEQVVIHGRVHALFSHLDDFLFEGHLLPGPDRHRWSRDLPAYEFPTGHRHKRVLVRRHDEQDRWLVTAWAADGETATVEVDIPELGRITVEATPGANVVIYRLEDGQPIQEPVIRVDPDASVEALGRVLREGDVIERQLALYRLANRGEAGASQIASALDDEDALVRRVALRSLSRLKVAGVVDHLRRGLADEDAAVRRLAVEALGARKSDDERIVSWLEPLQDDARGVVRDAVAEVLWPFDPPAVAPVSAWVEAAEPREVIALSQDGWRLRHDPKRHGHASGWTSPSFDDRDWTSISIGEPWQTFGYDYTGVAWYRGRLELPERIEHDEAVLHFEGVDERAWVWVNGEYVGAHDMGTDGWDVPSGWL